MPQQQVMLVPCPGQNGSMGGAEVMQAAVCVPGYNMVQPSATNNMDMGEATKQAQAYMALGVPVLAVMPDTSEDIIRGGRQSQPQGGVGCYAP